MRRSLVVLVLLAVSGCAGGGGKGGGAVDPAALDACLAWSNGVCRLAFLCVDAPAQDAAFAARYGADQSACFDKLMARCQSNQGAGAFGPSCGPGNVVNQTNLRACQDLLDTELCTDWMAMPSGGCENICGSSGGGTAGAGGGTAGAGGTGGGGTAGSSGSTATPVDFCFTGGYANCERLVECDPTSGSLADCKALFDRLCASASCASTFNAAAAAACVSAIRTATCSMVIDGEDPAICDYACP